LKRRDLLAAAGLMAAAPIAAAAKSAKPVTAAQAIAAAMKEPALRPFRAQIEAAMRVLDAYIDGFNARSVEAFDAAFNFPSVRLANNTLRIINKGDQKASLFTTGTLAEWDHTGWEHRQVIQAGADKVHVDCRFARYRKNGSLLAAFDSLYVINNEAGHWGVKIRSSYAP
jgi:hypothetical protein